MMSNFLKRQEGFISLNTTMENFKVEKGDLGAVNVEHGSWNYDSSLKERSSDRHEPEITHESLNLSF